MLSAFKDGVYELIPSGNRLQRLATGFKFVEGPVWDVKTNSLLFSDILGNTLYRWAPEGRVVIERCPSNMSNGLALKDGKLLACEHAGRCLSIGDPGQSGTPLVQHYEGKLLNSPNDVIVRSDGTIYFTDPNFGLTAEFGVLAQQEQPFQGVYSIHPATQELKLLVDTFGQPNGLAFSPDEKRLYIDDSATQEVHVYDVAADGSLQNGRLFARLDSSKGSGLADGLKIDMYENVYVSGPGGISIFDKTGTQLGLLNIPETVANLAWGGNEWKTLFITASTSLYSIETAVQGAVARCS